MFSGDGWSQAGHLKAVLVDVEAVTREVESAGGNQRSGTRNRHRK